VRLYIYIYIYIKKKKKGVKQDREVGRGVGVSQEGWWGLRGGMGRTMGENEAYLPGI
jgi:hypothetical protein